jgi:L,D-transpeptidase catalytic domain
MRVLAQIIGGLALIVAAIAVVALFTLLLILLRDTFPLATDRAQALDQEPRDAAPTPPPFMRAEEAVVVPQPSPTPAVDEVAPPPLLPVEPTLFEYVAVHDSCGPQFDGECLNARSGPGTEYPSVGKLRTGVVLKVGGKVETGSSTWYKIVFDEWLRYPERLTSNWYVSADHVEILYDEGVQHHNGTATTTKRIVVDRSEQRLYAYDGDELFMETSISTGHELTPTPRGTFTIFKKMPSRYMQGPLPYIAVSKYYDLPGVPWNMYFTQEGAIIHGAYWHNNFGSRYSSGCVNMRPAEARMIYGWADLGTPVTIRD